VVPASRPRFLASLTQPCPTPSGTHLGRALLPYVCFGIRYAKRLTQPKQDGDEPEGLAGPTESDASVRAQEGVTAVDGEWAREGLVAPVAAADETRGDPIRRIAL
jgi:hypothetical protein